MQILVIDHAGSFSLVPDLIIATEGKHTILTMASSKGDQNVETIKRVDPDVILCEWGDENAAILSSKAFGERMRRKIPIIVRLHGYESHDWFVKRIDWDRIHTLVTVSPYFRWLMGWKLKNYVLRVVNINNGVDLNKFKCSTDHYNPKQIAWVGYLNQKKGPALLRCVAESYPTMTVNVAGAFQCENTARLLRDERPKNMFFHGWLDDIRNFYFENSWVLSTSVTESFSYAVAEGMACGLTPMVYAWPGAEQLWPTECIWKSMADIGKIKLKDPRECRKWVEDRYSKERQINEFVELLESV